MNDSMVFNATDQIWFAQVSGDWNPIHVDPVESRRSLVGEQVVHGMHALIWALDCFWKTENVAFDSLSVSFLGPVLLGRPIELESIAEGDRWTLFVKDGPDVLISIQGAVGSPPQVAASPLEVGVTGRTPRERVFDDLSDASGTLEVAARGDEVQRRYPAAGRQLGALRLAAIGSLSRLVGMECPGLHSLYSALDLSLTANEDQSLNYSVVRHRSERQPIKMAIRGGGFDGAISAFHRPSPPTQPSFSDVQSVVAADGYVGQTALIVGGSRGLGEVTGKVVAAGGGKAVLTYFRGHDDAEAIADEIRDGGGSCDIAQLNILDPGPDWEALLATGQRFDHLYYFATPHIGGTGSKFFDHEAFQLFIAYYVEGFVRICGLCAETGPVSAFYPSTVFLETSPRDLGEYVAAKAAGEAAAHHLDRHDPNVSVVVTRLPRLETDQNLSILGRPPDALLGHVMAFVEQVSSS